MEVGRPVLRQSVPILVTKQMPRAALLTFGPPIQFVEGGSCLLSFFGPIIFGDFFLICMYFWFSLMVNPALEVGLSHRRSCMGEGRELSLVIFRPIIFGEKKHFLFFCWCPPLLGGPGHLMVNPALEVGLSRTNTAGSLFESLY